MAQDMRSLDEIEAEAFHEERCLANELKELRKRIKKLQAEIREKQMVLPGFGVVQS